MLTRRWLVKAMLVGAALALPQTCITVEDRLLGRLETTCPDGTYAISTWDPLLQRWTTTITSPPRGLPIPDPPHPAR